MPLYLISTEDGQPDSEGCRAAMPSVCKGIAGFVNLSFSLCLSLSQNLSLLPPLSPSPSLLTGSLVSHIGFQLAYVSEDDLEPSSSCFHLLSVGIIGICHSSHLCGAGKQT